MRVNFEEGVLGCIEGGERGVFACGVKGAGWEVGPAPFNTSTENVIL